MSDIIDNIFIIVLFAVIAGHIGKFIEDMHKSWKTGSYQEIHSRKKMREYYQERNVIKAKRYKEMLAHNSVTWENSPLGQAEKQELKAIDEKYAVPGSKAYKEIKQKEADWDAGKRW